ncbi:MAG: hypothetical protein GKR89_31085 [Candidatus Latescibacteria bacterium]|nr:hypothetical protein [Candidatus Latescibacterota bacterium]
MPQSWEDLAATFQRRGRRVLEEVCIALKCEEFEVHISAYVEEEMSGPQARAMEQHALLCGACNDTLEGIQQVRRMVAGLGQAAPSAHFKLQLSSTLQEELMRRSYSGWHRYLALGVAVGVALVILLWPEQYDQMALNPSPERQDEVVALQIQGERRLGRVWADDFPGLSRPGPQSHALVRTVSF